MGAPTKCDVYRAGAQAVIHDSACAGAAPPAECYVLDLATKRDAYYQTKYKPTGLATSTARAVRSKELEVYQNDINQDARRIQAKYGAAAAPAEISWSGLSECLWNADGSPGGPHENKYFERADLAALGYQPQPALGGAALKDKVPAALTARVPVWVDRVVNPDLAVVVIFVLLVIVFAVLMRSAYLWTQQAPQREAAVKDAWRKKMEAHDPYRGSAFESYPADPNAKLKALIPEYEARGYDMCAYRERLGMPLKGQCPNS